MSNEVEIERRFIATRIDSAYKDFKYKDIVQGYFDTTDAQGLRVRITDLTHGSVTRKSGSGIARQEVEKEIPVEAAFVLIEMCDCVLRKRRYLKNGWEIDDFSAPLLGLIIAERELASVDEHVARPPFIHEWIEVTDSLTNHDLARLARELKVTPTDLNANMREIFKTVKPFLKT